METFPRGHGNGNSIVEKPQKTNRIQNSNVPTESHRGFGDNDIGYRIKMESIVSNTT